nr:MAG TPA: hypothetical protein [Ackermannviridae sp.]
MSKYKVGFLVDSRANSFSTNAEVINLIEDWKYTEEEAKEIIKNDVLLEKLFEDWLSNTIETSYAVLETEEEIEDWDSMCN